MFIISVSHLPQSVCTCVLLADAVIERNVCCVVSVMFLATPMLVGIVRHTVLCTGKLTIISFTFKIKIYLKYDFIRVYLLFMGFFLVVYKKY